jgi:hypothetical protein
VIVIVALVALVAFDSEVLLGFFFFAFAFAFGLGVGTTFGTFGQAVAGLSVNGPSSAPV